MHARIPLTLASLITSSALAQVVVVPIPQIPGSFSYENAVLSSDANYAAMTTTGESPSRFIRWSASTNTLSQLVSSGANHFDYPKSVTNSGAVAGGWFGSPVAPFRGGAIWPNPGTVLANPFTTGFVGEPACAAVLGSTYFITESAAGMYSWNGFGAPVSHDRPAGTANIAVGDVDRLGNACVVTAALAGRSRAYRWDASGFQLLPTLEGFDASAQAISEDGTRVVGVLTNGSNSQGFFWSASTGLLSMQLPVPAGATIPPMRMSGDGTLVCGRFRVGVDETRFVWSLHDGYRTANAFAVSRGYTPSNPLDFQILDFNVDGKTALVRDGIGTLLLKNLGRTQCGSTGSCFASKTTPGCADVTCCERVCALDPFCCQNTWDAQCAIEAEASCRTGASCGDPQRITSFVAASYDYATGFDAVPSDESTCGTGDTKAVWRVYRATCNGAVTIDTCTEFADGPIVLSVYSSCGTEIACNEGAFVDCNPTGPTRANVAFEATAGSDYLIRIASIGGGASGAMSIFCESTCGAPGAGSCTETHAGAGCSDATCCGTVCVNDPYCCDNSWDAQCAGEAKTWCAAAGDFDRDGDIDASDLAELLAGWGLGGATDIDGDGLTGASDLAVLLGSWG